MPEQSLRKSLKSKKTVRVRAWAIVDAETGALKSSGDTEAIYLDQVYAVAENLGIDLVVPCTITYQISRRKNG